jgi:hypothetical protein
MKSFKHALKSKTTQAEARGGRFSWFTNISHILWSLMEFGLILHILIEPTVISILWAVFMKNGRV